LLREVEQVSPTGARLLSPPKPLQPLSRPATHGTSDFVRAVRTAGAQPLDAQPDIIDVEVLWEDAEEAYAPPVEQRMARSAYRNAQAPLLLTEPGTAIAAYRSAASTVDLPHQTIDLFA
jgi:hypothetical protein